MSLLYYLQVEGGLKLLEVTRLHSRESTVYNNLLGEDSRRSTLLCNNLREAAHLECGNVYIVWLMICR